MTNSSQEGKVLAMVNGSDKSFNILSVHHVSGTVIKYFMCYSMLTKALAAKFYCLYFIDKETKG